MSSLGLRAALLFASATHLLVDTRDLGVFYLVFYTHAYSSTLLDTPTRRKKSHPLLVQGPRSLASQWTSRVPRPNSALTLYTHEPRAIMGLRIKLWECAAKVQQPSLCWVSQDTVNQAATPVTLPSSYVLTSLKVAPLMVRFTDIVTHVFMPKAVQVCCVGP